jgi:hypothetical protein
VKGREGDVFEGLDSFDGGPKVPMGVGSVHIYRFFEGQGERWGGGAPKILFSALIIALLILGNFWPRKQGC